MFKRIGFIQDAPAAEEDKWVKELGDQTVTYTARHVSGGFLYNCECRAGNEVRQAGVQKSGDERLTREQVERLPEFVALVSEKI